MGADGLQRRGGARWVGACSEGLEGVKFKPVGRLWWARRRGDGAVGRR